MPFIPNDQAARILASIVESSDDAIIGTDLDGRILTWNDGATRLYGYPPADVQGASIGLLIPPEGLGEHARVLEQLRTGSRVAPRETTHVARDGRGLEVSVSISAIAGASGHVAGLSFIARDISARKRGEAALRVSDQLWRSVVESAVDGIVVIDARGRIESFNPAAQRLFGYAEADVIGENVSILMPAPYRQEHDGYLSRYLREGQARIIGIGREVQGQRRDGTVFPLHLSVGDIPGEGERKFTGILHDLSGRVRMEQLAREQAAMARVGEMAAVIAHEVKNPLAGVRGAIQVIGTRLPSGKDAAVVTEIIARIDALSRLMEDLLLFARPPQPKTAPVEIKALVGATAGLLSGDPAFRDVHVEVEGVAVQVDADAGLLKIVFLNLLINAAHAVQGSGTIRVSIAAHDNVCDIVLADSGPGIPSEILDKLFTPFFTTKARGTGLGLPTAKRIIEAHSGTIGIDSPPGGGTRVTIQLPIAR